MVHPFLVTNQLFGYIDGSIVCPPALIQSPAGKETAGSTTTNPSHLAWVANDAHVRMLLLSTISEASYPHVQGTTSRDLWLSLEHAYAPHSASREFTLKTQLLKLEMKGDESASDYLIRAKTYADALANIGEPVTDKDLVMLVLSGLREEYNGLKSTIIARHHPTVFSELQGLLADHDYMVRKPTPAVSPIQAFTAAASNHQQQSTSLSPATIQTLQNMLSQLGVQTQQTNNTSPQAFYTNRNNYNRGRGSANRRGRGNFHHNERGGNRSQFSWASNENTVYGTCNRCGIGHLPSQCPNRDPATLKRQAPSANFTNTRSQASSSWTPDTGSSHHVAPDLSGFDTAEPYCGADNLYGGNGKGLPIFHVGSSTIYSPNKSFSLTEILHVPDIKRHLLSVKIFCLDNNVYFEFHANFFVIKDTTTHRLLLTGPSNGGLYSIRLPPRPPDASTPPKLAFSAVRASAQTWHRRLGHPHSQLFRSMLSRFNLPLSSKCTEFSCDSCFIGKSSKLHLLSSSYKSSSILDLVFCDVWGPAPVPSYDGHLYFLLCVDHFSSYIWLF